jgi:hypothetical protein
MQASAYWWLRARESAEQGRDTEATAPITAWILLATVLTYACAIWLWPPRSALARLLDDTIPPSVELLHQHIPVNWVTPAIQWLALALLLLLCCSLGLGAISAAFMRHDSVQWSLLAIAGVLLWLHLALVLTAATTMLLARSGLATTTPSLPLDAPLTVGVGIQLWEFANAIPGLDITKTTHWVRPYVFTGWPAGAISLGFRLTALVALLTLPWVFARLIRSFYPQQEPEDRTQADRQNSR